VKSLLARLPFLLRSLLFVVLSPFSAGGKAATQYTGERADRANGIYDSRRHEKADQRRDGTALALYCTLTTAIPARSRARQRNQRLRPFANRRARFAAASSRASIATE
jgi:hypothetical protein